MSWLKTFRTKSAVARQAALPPPSAAQVHGLDKNYRLSRDQYLFAVKLVERIEGLYRGAPAYIAKRGLDPAIYFPGNEWKDLINIEGRVFNRGYADINLLRLHAPFAGFHMAILDRLDSRLHVDPEIDTLYLESSGSGFPEDIAERFAARVDPAYRLCRTLGINGAVVRSDDEMRQHLHKVPRRYAVRTPRLFGEIGLEVDGYLANPDTVLCQSRINGMLSGGVLAKLEADVRRRGRIRVMEIGPGYGALGQALHGIFGDSLEYIAVDLPSVLYHSALYLATLQAGHGSYVMLPGENMPDGFRNLFVANHLLGELGERLGPIDLAINTMSFPEMSEAQVRFYAETIHRLLRHDGLVFDENSANRPHHVDSKKILSEVFPYRKTVSSSVIRTKADTQDVWSKVYVPEVFDCTDHALRLEAV